jgi:hypothetical protein
MPKNGQFVNKIISKILPLPLIPAIYMFLTNFTSSYLCQIVIYFIVKQLDFIVK